jgi:hypothetical protein
MDWGYKTQGCIHWWALDDDNNLWCEREFSFRLMEPPAVAKRIKEIETKAGLWSKGTKGKSLIPGVADTQLWEKRGDSGRSKADQFAEHGVLWSPADKKSRFRNYERLGERLKDHGGGTKVPSINFFNTCVKLIETIPSLQRDPNDPECPIDGGDDHWCDSATYAVAYASHGRAAIPSVAREKKDRLDDLDDDDDQDSAPQGRGQYGYGSMI